VKIFYTGNICADDFFEKLMKTQAAPPSLAQLKLEKNILKGLEQNQVHVTAYGQYPIRGFPGNRELFLKRETYVISEYLTIINPSMLNVVFLKQLLQFVAMFCSFLGWVIKNRKEEKIYFSYSVYPPVTIPCMILGKLSRMKLVSYVSEIPELRLFYNQGSFVRRILLKILTKTSMFVSRRFSHYIYITEQVNDFFGAKKENFVVIEGIASLDFRAVIPKKEPTDKFVVMYAGGINQQNGIEKLIGAWEFLDDFYQLWLFGSGDYVSTLQQRIEDSENITYFGNRPHAEILAYEKRASVLINPRFSQNEYTKYSFPSKTIEYLESGTPIVTSRLGGIPKEYYEFLSILPDGEQEIAEILKELSTSKNYALALEKSAEGFRFIQKKNAQNQVKKIIEMLQKG